MGAAVLTLTFTHATNEPDYRVATVAGTAEVIRWSCATHPVYGSGLDDAEVILLRRALRQLSRATGVRFTYEGATTAEDVIPGAIHVRAVEDDTDVLAWASRVNDGPTYTAAVVTLNADRDLDSRYEMTLLLHELGHAVGLDHVDSWDEIMSGAVLTGDTAYEDGDRAGLALVGCRDRSG